jgi:hypothetical protein
MIVETIFSTLDTDGAPNFAPMGLVWGNEYITVRPYRNTQTFRNLLAGGYGVANITDNVLAYVETALYNAALPHFPAKEVPGVVYADTCSWREVEVVSNSGSADRAEMRCRVRHAENRKEFVGFCRAGGAVIEAAILATRTALLGRGTVEGQLTLLREIVEKTGDTPHHRAMQLIVDFVRKTGE